MFERYTERARRVIFFARYEASHLGSRTIETEHLLLGVIREDKTLVEKFIRNSSSMETIRKEIESRSPRREKVSTSIDLPLSAECKTILRFASDTAEELNHRLLGPEHLLLGLVKEEGCLASQILKECGMTPEALLEDMLRGLPREEAVAGLVPYMAPNYRSLVFKLDGAGLTAPMEHLVRAAKAIIGRQFATAESELQGVLETLVDAIKQRHPKEEVFAPLFKGLGWPISLADIHTGISEEGDCKFKFNLTLSLAEVLMARAGNL